MGSMRGVSQILNIEWTIECIEQRSKSVVLSSYPVAISSNGQCVENRLCLMTGLDLHHQGTMMKCSTTVAPSLSSDTYISPSYYLKKLLQVALLSFVNPHSLYIASLPFNRLLLYLIHCRMTIACMLHLALSFPFHSYILAS